MFGKAKIILTACIVLAGLMLQGCDSSPPQSRLETAKANAQSCVEPAGIMKVKHMDFIQHQQDDTVYGGLRSTKYGFKTCINCHVPAQQDGKPVNYLTDNGELNEEHFCATCHKYSAVKLDCFECHSDNPQIAEQPIPPSPVHGLIHPGSQGGAQ